MIGAMLVLGIHDGKDPSVALVRDGALVSGATGGESLNPLESGRSFLEVRPFHRAQKIEGDFVFKKVFFILWMLSLK